MKTILVHSFGGPEVLSYEDVPRPEPAGDELLVRVHAAGVNALDWLVRQGGFPEFDHITTPWIPGWDMSGVVEEVGSGVTQYRVGDSVFGMVRMPQPGNTYAEYAAVPARDVVAKPTTLDHQQSAAIPMAALTAWRALFDEGRLQPAQRVLIHAAAGGVGHLATQLAAAHGARVVATASRGNEEFVRSLEAAEFVDYRAQAFEEYVEPVDVVIDSIGGPVQERSLLALKDGGVLVSLPGDVPGVVRREAAKRGIDVRYFSVRSNAAALLEICDLIERGLLRPTVSAIRPLADAREAHEEAQAGHVKGKLVLDATASPG